MPAKDPEKRRATNARYYDRIKHDPVKKVERRMREKDWRQANRLNAKEWDARSYERRRSDILFKHRLDVLLARVRAFEIARGRVPFDG